MITILVPILLSDSSLPHVVVARILEKEQPAVEKVIGPGTKQRKGPGYLFSVRGFDHFWVLGFGKDMTRLVCRIAVPCNRDQALGCLGLSASRASVKQLALGNAPIATRRNCQELTGVAGLPPERYHHKSWKVEYEEDGDINRERMAKLRSRIGTATGTARIDLIRQCYDWHAKISIEQ